MSEFNASNFKKEEGGQGPDIIGTTELTSPYFMVPPSGTTAQRPSGCAPGTLRFNTDIGSLEYFKGDTIGWESINRTTPILGGAIGPTYAGSTSGTGARGLYMGGSTPTKLDVIDFITVSTLGNSQDFGNLTSARTNGNSFGSQTRGALCGGVTPSTVNDTEMVFFASLGNATDYATLTSGRKEAALVNDQTRAVHAGGGDNVMQYLTIEQGGSWVDFGDLQNPTEQCMGLSSSTRGVIAEGNNVPAGLVNTIDFITIATLGNAADFGDTTDARYGGASGSNATRGCFAGGWSPNVVNTIDYVTTATTGNATDFGDMTQAKYTLSGSMSSQTRMVVGGGHQNPDPAVNVIEYWEFATTGNGTDFGDLSAAKNGGGMCSNGHGGL